MNSCHSSTYWLLVIIEPRSAIFFVPVRQCFQILSFLPYSLLKKKKLAPTFPVYRESKVSVCAYFCIYCSSVTSLFFCLLKMTSMYFVQFFAVCGLYAYVIHFLYGIIAFCISSRYFFSHLEYYPEQS